MLFMRSINAIKLNKMKKILVLYVNNKMKLIIGSKEKKEGLYFCKIKLIL